MTDTITVAGIVLSASPVGENDKRLVLLTRELGKITAFARGARRPGNLLMAPSNPFVFGSFTLIQGKNSYNLISAQVMNYFLELTQEMPTVYYGFYFLELASYYGTEGVDGTDMLNLIYLSLKALLNEKYDKRLVRCVFEIRILMINGEYAPPDTEHLENSYDYTRAYIALIPIKKLYSFEVTEEVLTQLETHCRAEIRRHIDRKLKSQEILEQMINVSAG